MEHISKALTQLNPEQSLESLPNQLNRTQRELKNYFRISDPAKASFDGFNALDLIGEPVNEEEALKVQQYLKLNFGVNYDEAKVKQLFTVIASEGWTKERLKRTCLWFLKNKRYPNWTIADWFDYGVKLYPYSWYLNEIKEKGATDDQFEVYRIDGKALWKYKDGEELPFERIR